MACFHCDHKRPPDEFVENHLQSRPHSSKTRLEKVADMPGVSNAWNFDFDDNESDGADVAAFEYADPPRFAEDTSMENHAQTESTRGFEDGSFETSQLPRTNGRGRNSNLYQRTSGTGFDDFDDDINSYEIDASHDSPIQKSSSKDFSQIEGFSESEDFDGSDIHLNAHQGNASSHHKQSRLMPNWKSSHIADSRYGTRSRGGNGPYRETTFGSDDEVESISDSDDNTNRGFEHEQRNRDKWSSNGRSYRSGADEFDSESNDEDDLPSSRNNMRGSKAGFGRRGLTSMGHGQFESARGVQFRSNGRTNNRKNSFGNVGLDRYPLRNGKGRSQGYSGKSMDESRGNMHHFGQREGFGSQRHGYRGKPMEEREGFGSRRQGYSGKSMDERRSNMRHFGQREGFGPRAHGKLDLHHDQSDMERDNRRRIIER